MAMGILYTVLAGIFISLQGVFNTWVSEKIGSAGTITLVHGVGLAASLLVLMTMGNSQFGRIGEVSNKIYLFGGALGVVIVFGVMKGIAMLGTAYSVSILLVTQLIMAMFIDSLGLFGTEPIKVSLTRVLGIVVMIVGILVFKYEN
jgi:transporter family-2 protein